MRKYYRYTRRKARRENLKKLFFNPNTSPLSKAYAMFIGVFIGVLPIWGVQILSALASAQYFKVDKPMAVIGSYINLTPLYPVLIYFSLKIGALIMGNVEVIPSLSEISLVTAKTYFWLYALGCIPVAAITALIFALITYVAASYVKFATKKLQPLRVKSQK